MPFEELEDVTSPNIGFRKDDYSTYYKHPQEIDFSSSQGYLDGLSSDELKYLNEKLLDECSEENYGLEQALLAKSDLIPFEYNHLRALSEEIRKNPDKDLVSNFMSELHRQLKDTQNDIEQIRQMSPTDYNLAQKVLDLFLMKEKNLNDTIRGVGKNLNTYNQNTSDCDHLKDLYVKKEKIKKELEKKDSAEKREELEKINEEIEVYKQKLNGKKIVAPRWFPGIQMETTIEFPDLDEDTMDGISEMKDYLSNIIKEIKARISEGFASLQEFFQTLMQCFKCIQNAIRHYEETFSRIVRNYKTNG